MLDPRAPRPGLDVSRALDLASERVDVGELFRRGHRRVAVIDRRRIEMLVQEAVKRALGATADERHAMEVRRIEIEAQRRFDELMRRHQDVLRLKQQAEEALHDLARKVSAGESAGSGPDLEPLARQVAAMNSLLRAEGTSESQGGAQAPILGLLQKLAEQDGKPGDERLDRILYQVERLSKAVEATERAMKRGGVASPAGGGDGGRARAAVPAAPSGASAELFRAILEENLKLAALEGAGSAK